MSIYSNTNYRKIYEDAFGPIPKDNDGRSYEIHHVDGNHTNNELSNLKCVSIKEHYNIHYSQEDWGACLAIARRMNKSPDELRELNRNQNLKRIADKTHNFIDSEFQSTLQQRRIKEGTHNFLGKSNPVYKMISDKTHPFYNPEIGRQSAYLRLSQGTHPSQKKYNCERCGKSIQGSGNYMRWHGVNCRSKSI